MQKYKKYLQQQVKQHNYTVIGYYANKLQTLFVTQGYINV